MSELSYVEWVGEYIESREEAVVNSPKTQLAENSAKANNVCSLIFIAKNALYMASKTQRADLQSPVDFFPCGMMKYC
jgi:hypothetical protein